MINKKFIIKDCILTGLLMAVFLFLSPCISVLAEEKVVQIEEITADLPEEDYSGIKIYSANQLRNTLRSDYTYGSNYGYLDLANRSNAAARQKFYLLISNACTNFDNSANNLTSTLPYGNYILDRVNFIQLGLNANEALETYAMFKNDRPQYFWLDSWFVYDETGNLYITVSPEYAQYSDRDYYTQLINRKFPEYIATAAKYQHDYEKIKAVYDYIILKADYVYDEYGEPSQEVFAHNALGIIDESNAGAVCESYAKAFAMVLNALDIDNVYVTGYSYGFAHAWNMAKLDDGNYYNFDITWDDGGKNLIFYNYFARGTDFYSSHQPQNSMGTGINFLYDIPEVPSYDFDEDNFVVASTEAEEATEIPVNTDVITIASNNGIIDVIGFNNITVQGHTAGIGWRSEGITTGVSGRALEAFRATSDNPQYNVYYRSYVNGYGWLAWASNGEISGSTGLGLPITRIQIKLDTSAASLERSDVPFKNICDGLSYYTHVQDHGDMPACNTGGVSGTTGEAKRVELVYLSSKIPGVGFTIKGHIQDIGDVISLNGAVGTVGQSKRIEALTVDMTGTDNYNLYYRAHVQDYGWSGYVSEGNMAGTSGQAKRIESVIFILENKSRVTQ